MISKNNYKPLPSYIPAGSMIKSSEGTYWHSCGTWQLAGVTDSIPCILGYVANHPRYNGLPAQKFIETKQGRFAKVWGLPFDVYREYYHPLLEHMLHEKTLGKLSFLKRSFIEEIVVPTTYTEQYIAQIQPEGKLLLELCEIFDLSSSEIGVIGSSLLNSTPIRRPEVDFAIYSHEKSRRVFEKIKANRRIGLFADEYLSPFYLPFSYKGIWFDPQFSEGPEDTNLIDGAFIKVLHRQTNVQLTITDIADGVFFPAIYGTDKEPLLTFRPGQRGLFSLGETIVFKSLALVETLWKSGKSQTMYAVLENEYAETISK